MHSYATPRVKNAIRDRSADRTFDLISSYTYKVGQKTRLYLKVFYMMTSIKLLDCLFGVCCMLLYKISETIRHEIID